MRALDNLRNNALGLLVAGCVAVVVLCALAWFVFVRPGQNARRAAEARAGSTIADGAAKAARDAMNVAADNAAREAAGDKVTGANRDEILKAPDAGATAGAAGDAGLRVLCQRPAVSAQRRCRELLETRP